jgi:hypothetical protein
MRSSVVRTCYPFATELNSTPLVRLTPYLRDGSGELTPPTLATILQPNYSARDEIKSTKLIRDAEQREIFRTQEYKMKCNVTATRELLNRYTLQRCIEGSNPSVSASSESKLIRLGIRSLFRAYMMCSIGLWAERGKVVGPGRLGPRVKTQFSRKPLIKIKQILPRTGGSQVVFVQSRLRVFYATLARKVP